MHFSDISTIKLSNMKVKLRKVSKVNRLSKQHENDCLFADHLKTCEDMDRQITRIKLEIDQLSKLSTNQSREIEELSLQQEPRQEHIGEVSENSLFNSKVEEKIRQALKNFHDFLLWKRRNILIEKTVEIVNGDQNEIFLITCPECEGIFKIPLAWTSLTHGFYIGNYVQHVILMHTTRSLPRRFNHLVEM